MVRPSLPEILRTRWHPATCRACLLNRHRIPVLIRGSTSCDPPHRQRPLAGADTDTVWWLVLVVEFTSTILCLYFLCVHTRHFPTYATDDFQPYLLWNSLFLPLYLPHLRSSLTYPTEASFPSDLQTSSCYLFSLMLIRFLQPPLLNTLPSSNYYIPAVFYRLRLIYMFLGCLSFLWGFVFGFIVFLGLGS